MDDGPWGFKIAVATWCVAVALVAAGVVKSLWPSPPPPDLAAVYRQGHEAAAALSVSHGGQSRVCSVLMAQFDPGPYEGVELARERAAFAMGCNDLLNGAEQSPPDLPRGTNHED